MQKRTLLVVVATVSAWMVACAPRSVAFRPAKVEPDMLRAYPAAYYSVIVGKEPLGRVKVATDGAYLDGGDAASPVVGIQLRLRNDSESPMHLDLLHTDLELVTRDKRSFVVERPTGVHGASEVAPGAMGRTTLVYALPDGVSVGDVASFELNWSIVTSGGPYSESTAFVRQEHASGARYVYYPTYVGYPFGWPNAGSIYPYWYDPYGPGVWIDDRPREVREPRESREGPNAPEGRDQLAPRQHPR